METTSQRLGAVGEELAYHHLISKGYKVLLKNYECVLGEIDLVAKEKGALVFVEVKTRSSAVMGHPAEAVTFEKRRQIVKTAKFYMKRYGINNVPCRFDVVSIFLNQGRVPKVEVIENAFLEAE